MKIKSANVIAPKLVYNIEYKSYAFSPKEDIRNSLLGEFFNSIISRNKEIEILKRLKQVKVTWEGYKKREYEEGKLIYALEDENNDKPLNEYYEKGESLILSIWGNEDCFPKEKLELVPVRYGSEVATAISCSDITEIEDIFNSSNKEYYSTPEVIEVLEKWKEALERWNNLEERQKMIEEYEKEHGIEKKKFLGLF